MLKSPINLPLGLSMGVSTMRPTGGTRPAMMRDSQPAASGPLTAYLPKLWISLMPTAPRTAAHSTATEAKAFERRKVGTSKAGSPGGAK